ncbi:4210_t:CDS:1, partial [Cetraspora pellucida]
MSGRRTDPVDKTAPVYENSVYILNTETYSWITSFDSSNKTSNKTGQGTTTNGDGVSKNGDGVSKNNDSAD